MITPDFDTFQSLYNKKKPQLVWTKLSVDTETPISASLKLQKPGEPFFLLESVEGGQSRGRYSVIGMLPDQIWKCDSTSAYVSTNGSSFVQEPSDVLSSLRQFYSTSQLDVEEGLPPMSGGVIGYLSYDAIRFKETTIPKSNPDTIGIPVGMFMRPTMMLVFDSVTSDLFCLVSVYHHTDQSVEDAYQAAKIQIDTILATLAGPMPQAEISPKTTYDFKPHISQQDYYDMVKTSVNYINEGDIFQVVPSQRFSTPFSLSPFALYRSVRRLNPSPFLFFLDLGDFQLVGASPEIMVRVRHNKVTIRPLAGTRKRGATEAEDKMLSEELLSDAKELSEHLMLVDLSRNDVGRVSKAGSVVLTERNNIEYYSHVMHITSNVEGDLDPAYDALDALFSGLPVGTVSGAPKVRAMQIIDEIESEARSFYAGCVGYFSANGTVDTCITLRTGLIKDNILYVQAGGGVVAESTPELEYQESLNKVKALMMAADQAYKFT